jgi:hypothetical protein
MVVQYTDGSTYTGTCVGDHEFEGEGVLEHACGITYKGSFSAGLPDGEGVIKYGPHEKQLEFHILCKNGDVIKESGMYKYYDDSVFIGTLVNGSKDGPGKVLFPSGSKFMGSYVKGEPKGFGVYEYSSGVKFEGEYAGKGERRCGPGKYTLPTGEVYDIEYRNGKAYNGILVGNKDGKFTKTEFRDGKPVPTEYNVSEHSTEIDPLTKKKEATFHSQFAQPYADNLLFHFQSFHKFEKGLFYEGDRDVSGTKQGLGKESYSPGVTYEGQFVNGKKHGHGVFTYKDLAKYEGEFENGLFHGTGVYSIKSGETYKGEFANGAMHGEGSILRTPKSTKVLNVKFEHGALKEESGVYTFKDGNTFRGSFVKNDKGKLVKHGLGSYKFASNDPSKGGILIGEYVNNFAQGICEHEYINGMRYVGEYVNSSRHGSGEFRCRSGRTFSIEYRNGLPWEGTYVRLLPEHINDNGKKYFPELEVTVKDGKMVSETVAHLGGRVKKKTNDGRVEVRYICS